MSAEREYLLRELELLPVWHLREPMPPAAEPVAPAAHPLVITVDAAQPLPATAVMDIGTADSATSEDIVISAAAQSAEVMSVQSVPQASPQAQSDIKGLAVSMEEFVADGQSTEPDYTDIPEGEPSLPSMATTLGDGRREAIMRMDWTTLQEVIPNCRACHLEETRTQTVFGVGDPQAEWLFVGEAPGAEEDRRGEPFVGQAGKLLDNMLAAIKLKRGDNVFIANVLKCRPPNNRDPHGEEVLQCDPFLKRQVELIRPKLIVALGKFAAQSLLANDASIASMRGRLHDYNGVPVIITYHPAYLLRNLPDKARAWEDLCYAQLTMQGLQSQAAAQSNAVIK